MKKVMKMKNKFNKYLNLIYFCLFKKNLVKIFF